MCHYFIWCALSDNESRPLICPFCGAPQRGYVAADTLQVKCEYCGGVFLTKPSIEGEFRCSNHPQKLAIGTCNDCARSFCGDCLHYYALETERERASLYLCPDCLRRRHAEKADVGVYAGLAALAVGFLLVILGEPVLLVFGVLTVVFGVGMVVYAGYQRGQEPEELTISQVREEKEQRRAAVEDSGGVDVDVEELYNQLVAQYATRWGAMEGIQTLQEEIQAYIRHGESFEIAVERIYQRQKKRT